jgi:CheY-like chemotaxis protein
VTNDVRPLAGDMTQLQQVLLNLAVNARDAMPDGGTLTITAQNIAVDEAFASMRPDAEPGDYVQLTVSDTGAGISSADLERIFDPFFTTKEVGEGTGLGLATSLAIVESHGGFIHVYSEPERGTSFKVFLPAAGATVPAADVPAEDLPRGSGELVLVAEDEPAVRAVTQQTLESFGYKVVTASDGAEAVAVFAQHTDRVALVLTDMMMPVMDGVAAIHAIRRLDPSVRVIASTGLHDDTRAARAAEAGVTHFLPKPYSSATLVRIVHEGLHAR